MGEVDAYQQRKMEESYKRYEKNAENRLVHLKQQRDKFGRVTSKKLDPRQSKDVIHQMINKTKMDTICEEDSIIRTHREADFGHSETNMQIENLNAIENQ